VRLALFYMNIHRTLTAYSLLNLGNTVGVDKRQTPLPTRHNISQIITPLVTGRWIASIDSQLQLSPQTDASKISCTLSICTGPLICGARQAIGVDWATLSLKVSLRANQPQQISFVTNCSAPAYVGLKNMVIPGLGQPLTSTVISTRTMTLTAPPEISTITQTLVDPPQVSTITTTVDPTPEPIQTYSVPVLTECEAGSVILVSAPNNSDFMVLSALDQWAPYDAEVASANQSLTFTPCNGRNLCTFHTFDEYYHCDWVGQPQTVPDHESLTLTCPEASVFPVQRPDPAYGTSNVNIKIGRTCPYIVVQMGCSRNADCTVDAYSSATPEVSFVYPWIASFRVKVVGSRWTRAQWSVSHANIDSEGPKSYDQRRGEWLDVKPASRVETGLISIVVECKTTEEIQVRMYNACPKTVILGIPDVGDWLFLQPSDERTFYLEKENPIASLTPISGEQLCAKIEQTGIDYCDYEMLEFGMLDQDVIQISCPDESFPTEVDITGETIRLDVGISSTTLNLAAQMDCVPGNPCSASRLGGGWNAFIGEYPVTAPTTRLRVRAFGSILPSRMVYAEWSVQFSGDPATKNISVQANAEWLDISVPSDATSIQLYGSAFYDPPQEPTPEPTPGPPPNTEILFSLANNCVDIYNIANALLGVPRDSDLFLALSDSGSSPTRAGFDSDNPKLIFTSLTGRKMCAVVQRTGTRICGTDNVVVSDLEENDFLSLDCPDAPPYPVVDSGISVSLFTHETSPNLVVQLGCEQPGGPCFSYTTKNNAHLELQYSLLKPMLRFRVRVFTSIADGQRLNYVEWQVRISKGPDIRPKVSYYQPKGQWLDISILSDATYIEIHGYGSKIGSIPEGPDT
jgi:hypothetical protein